MIICGASIIARSKNTSASTPLATSGQYAVPQVVFTDPEVAAVGLTDREARAKGLKIRLVDCEMDGIPGAALHTDCYSGHARIVVDREQRVVVGATFLGPEVGDLIHAATIAIVGKGSNACSRARNPVLPDRERGVDGVARSLQVASWLKAVPSRSRY